MAFALIALGVVIAVAGIYVGSTDDAPGAALMGIVFMLAAVVLAVRTARNRLRPWAVRSALAVGSLVALFAGWLAYLIAEAQA